MLNGHMNEISVDYDIIYISGNEDIHKYLMKVMV